MTDFLSVTPSELTSELGVILQGNKTAVQEGRHRIVANIMGPSSAGKSAIVRQVVDSLGMRFFDFRANLHEPVDLLGYPYMKNKDNDSIATRTEYAPFDWLPLDGENNEHTVILMDEVPNATPDMQAALYQPVYDFMVGGHKLSDHVSIVMCGNRLEDHGNTFDMPTPLKLRVATYVLETEIDDFIRFWFSINGNPTIGAFLRFQPTFLNNIDHDAYTSPCSRQWHILSDRLQLPTPNRFKTVQAHVGLAAARAFIAFERDIENIPDMDALIEHPMQAPVPEGALLYAVCNALVSRVSVANFKNIVRYVDRIPSEMQVMVIRDIVKTQKPLAQHEAFMDWISRNAEVGNML